MSSFIRDNIFLITIGFVIFISIGYAFFRFFYQKKLFRELAQELGGHLSEGQSFGGMQINVRHNDRIHTIDKFTTGSGDSQQHWHRVSVPMKSYFGNEAEIYKETMLFSSIGKAFGGQDIIVGHNKFDQTFIIKANDSEWIKSILNTNLINKHIRYNNMKMELNTGTLTITKKAKLSKPALKAMLELSKLYADAISSNQLEQRVTPQLEDHSGSAW